MEKKQNKQQTKLTLSQKVGEKTISSRVQQSFSHGRSRTVAVEVKRRRFLTAKNPDHEPKQEEQQVPFKPQGISTEEWSARLKAFKMMPKAQEQVLSRMAAVSSERKNQEKELKKVQETREKLEKECEAEREIRAQKTSQEEAKKQETQQVLDAQKHAKTPSTSSIVSVKKDPHQQTQEDAELKQDKKLTLFKKGDIRRRNKPLTLTKAMSLADGEHEERTRSLASLKRARNKQRTQDQQQKTQRVLREVIIPEIIGVQELANRMAERGSDVIKELMKLGVVATITENIDGDTAECVATEFGHKVKRVADSDVEEGLTGSADEPKDMLHRPPIVTIMGHVDHGKTSLLDALRQSNVVISEAGGITQHIGAYQITTSQNQKITFIDTPGHAAFTAMRARGAHVTDIVVLVVAADDGVKEQTIEALSHIKSAGVSMIVAINKMDKTDANPKKVKTELLNHDIVVEEMGGDVLTVEISAHTGQGLDRLQEAILFQAELLDFRANPNRLAEGVVIESCLAKGRGPSATVLIKRGSLHVGDVFVVGTSWGKVRALTDHANKTVLQALPSMPVEVLGSQKTPGAGDDFVVVNTESKAREVVEFRQKKIKKHYSIGTVKDIDNLFSKAKAEQQKQFLMIVIKADVQGSLEAIISSLKKMETDEVGIKLLHTGVGEISENDITLSYASNGFVVGFNVRANTQARQISKKENVEISYHSIIYDLIKNLKSRMEGMLSPTLKEHFLGYAHIKQIFTITKVGKIAGCDVTEGTIQRGMKVRLLRNNVVIHEGHLKTLKRFKDDVSEVRTGHECGMAFESYQDIKVDDMIECFSVEKIARTLSAQTTSK